MRRGSANLRSSTVCGTPKCAGPSFRLVRIGSYCGVTRSRRSPDSRGRCPLRSSSSLGSEREHSRFARSTLPASLAIGTRRRRLPRWTLLRQRNRCAIGKRCAAATQTLKIDEPRVTVEAQRGCHALAIYLRIFASRRSDFLAHLGPDLPLELGQTALKTARGTAVPHNMRQTAYHRSGNSSRQPAPASSGRLRSGDAGQLLHRSEPRPPEPPTPHAPRTPRPRRRRPAA